jgi:predicted alpha/beta hydrolase
MQAAMAAITARPTPDARGAVTTTDLRFAARDGYALAGTLVAPAQPRGAVLLCAGTGFPRGFYVPLACFLAERGHAVLCFDYRGIGDSAPGTLRGFDATMSDWALRDMPGALDALTARHPTLPLAWIGHSFGGQVVGVVPGIERVERIVTIAASIGWWPWHRAPRKWGAALLWHLYGPLAVRLHGCIPRGAIWQGRALPAGVYRQWRRWCLSPRYFAIDVGGTLGPGYFDALRAPIRALAFTDDWIATPRTVAALHALYAKPGVECRWLAPREFGLERIDHEGVFLPSRAAVWPRIAAELER